MNRENDQKNMDLCTERGLENYPSYIKNYFYYLRDMVGKIANKSTAQSRYNNLQGVKKFYDYIINKYNKELNEINEEEFRDYWENVCLFNQKELLKGNKVENGASRINGNLSMLVAFYSYVVRYENFPVDYSKSIDKKVVPKVKVKDELIFLNKEEIDLLNENIENGVGSSRQRRLNERVKNRDKLIVALDISTGIRARALRNIDLEDLVLDKENSIITVWDKGNKIYSKNVPDQFFDLINQWLEDREKILQNCKNIKEEDKNALFISIRGTRLTVKALDNMLEKYTYNIKKKITMHKLRATGAMFTYFLTKDPYQIKEFLEHENINTSKYYVQAGEEMLKNNANVFGQLFA